MAWGPGPLSSCSRPGPNGMATHERSTITFSIASPIERSDLPGLFSRVCMLLASSGATLALCDVTDADANAVTVDALARLQLVARRSGCQVRLRNASRELCALVAFMGLQDVLPE
jgi:ABC-type transporter Mla MlaB component